MKIFHNGFRRRYFLLPFMLLFLLTHGTSMAQEKKLLRVVFVSLSWNSEIPFRAAMARNFFKSQGLQIEPIFIRGGPAAIAALVSGEVDFASIGGAQAVMRALEKGLIAAAPFSPEDAVRLMKSGYPLIANLAESLSIPQSIIVGRNEFMEKHPETSKRFLKALVMGVNLARTNKKETIKAGYDAGLKGDPETVSAAYDLYASALAQDLNIAVPGIQSMLEEDIRAGLVDSKFTVDKVINDQYLKKAQEELRAEGRLKP